MLHPGVRDLDQLVPVLLERILTEILLKRLHHWLRLRELAPGLLQILRQAIEIHRQVAQPVTEVFIAADIERYAIVVDGVVDGPVIARITDAEVGFSRPSPVRSVAKRVRNCDAQSHVFHLVALLILVGPPDAGADSLARGGDPGPAGRVFTKADTAEASCFLR